MLDTLCATSCYDLHRVGFENTVVLTRPESRAARLGAMCDQIKEIVLPWFASTRDPKRLAQAVPDALLHSSGFALDLVEFLVSRNEREQARLLIDRALALEPKLQAAFDEGRRLAHEGIPHWHTPESLDWSSAVLGLA